MEETVCIRKRNDKKVNDINEAGTFLYPPIYPHKILCGISEQNHQADDVLLFRLAGSGAIKKIIMVNY